jgi:hypothetical protein
VNEKISELLLLREVKSEQQMFLRLKQLVRDFILIPEGAKRQNILMTSMKEKRRKGKEYDFPIFASLFKAS